MGRDRKMEAIIRLMEQIKWAAPRRSAARETGAGDAATSMGGLEMVAMEMKDGGPRVADAITQPGRSYPQTRVSIGETNMEKMVFTIAEFCTAFHVSRGRLHELTQAGLGPKVYRIASRPYISMDAAKEWQRLMESGAAENFKPLPAKTPGRRGRYPK